MTDSWQLALWGAAGAVLAVVYFGGLWWTVRQLPVAPRPWLLYVASLVARLAVLLATLAAVMIFTAGDWQRLVAFLAGFLLLRLALLHWARAPRGASAKPPADSPLLPSQRGSRG